jgi:hypothetical protein
MAAACHSLDIVGCTCENGLCKLESAARMPFSLLHGAAKPPETVFRAAKKFPKNAKKRAVCPLHETTISGIKRS